MKFEYDSLVIGMGPAGMAVSAMAAEMGLKVCAIEKRKIGGECMNVGCIPSKALLQMAKVRHTVGRLNDFALSSLPKPEPGRLFELIQKDLQFINEKKTVHMFNKVDLILGQGSAEFVDPHTVKVGDRQITAKRIFICTGTQPAIPPVPGMATIKDILTNENLFSLDHVPKSMIILGGGAIGCEMAQAFFRLGCKTTVVHMDPHLLPAGDPMAGNYLEGRFKEEGIGVYNGRKIQKVEQKGGGVQLTTEKGERLDGERILVAAGRKIDISPLKLEKAGVSVGERGIPVNNHLQTNKKHIYAVGDCNGHHLLTHAAMHQGMMAIMNTLLPWPFKRNFKKFVVPWTVFTDPAVSKAGLSENELQKKDIKYQIIETKYGDYGAAIAEKAEAGLVRVLASPLGKIYGATVIGEGSGEMIQEWALAIQKKIRLHDIMLLQHSFPTMSFLNKRISETWAMGWMKKGWLRAFIKSMY